MHDETVFDAVSGEPITASGWTVTRRIDGDQHHFKSLTGIVEALKGGTFGLKFVLGNGTMELPDYLDMPDDDAFECTCCDEEAFDAADATGTPTSFGRMQEPRGWDAPEFRDW